MMPSCRHWDLPRSRRTKAAVQYSVFMDSIRRPIRARECARPGVWAAGGVRASWGRASCPGLRGKQYEKSPFGTTVLQKSFFPQIEGGLGEVGGLAEVAPIVFIGAESDDVLSLRREAQIGVDDGKNALFGEHGKKARGNDVDAGDGEGLQRGWTSCR